LQINNDYYIYRHVDPTDHRLVYVGLGTGSRAWAMGTYRSTKDARYGRRAGEHDAWMNSLMQKGFLPSDWVHIVEKQLTKEDAHKLELELIKTNQPIYNSIGTDKYKEKLRKCSSNVHSFLDALHKMGYGYQRIAYLTGSDTPKTNVMSIKRMLSYV